MTTNSKPPAAPSHEVGEFLKRVATTPQRKVAGVRGRLIFAMDATASREPTWDNACQLQSEMFKQTAELGGLSVQLCYYRGFNQFHTGPWCDDSGQLLNQMSGVRCLGGHTQIGRVLDQGLAETRARSIQALVFVGDAVEEDADSLCQKAGELGILKVPVFVFQEGTDTEVSSIFQQIAKLSGGAFAPFDTGSAAQLLELLAAVAVYAAGGRQALQHYTKQAGDHVLRLTRQLK